jgi:hypothetical protein
MKPGNSVEEKTLTTGKKDKSKPGCPTIVGGTGEAVDERRCDTTQGVESALQQ